MMILMKIQLLRNSWKRTNNANKSSKKDLLFSSPRVRMKKRKFKLRASKVRRQEKKTFNPKFSPQSKA